MTAVEDLFDVRDARVVVTGAASGLGLAMAEVMAEAGARVTLADLDPKRLEDETARLAEAGGQVQLLPGRRLGPGPGAGADRRRRRGAGWRRRPLRQRRDLAGAWDHRSEGRHRGDRDRGLGAGGGRQPERGRLHDGRGRRGDEGAGQREDRRHGLERRPQGGAAGRLLLRGDQGRRDPGRPPGGRRAGAAMASTSTRSRPARSARGSAAASFRTSGSRGSGPS